jgi:CBS domain-containing protein
MKVREIMTTDVRCAAPETTLDDVARMMREEDTGAIPVLDGDDLVGIVTDRDIVVRCIAEGDDPREITAQEVISGSPQTITPERNVEEASRIMAEAQVRRLPVCENGRLVGIISIGDIAVKQPEETIAAETLESVSEGVKATKAGQRQAAQASVRGPRTPAVHGGGRQESMEQEPGRKQGITNRAVDEEEERQSKVVPFRAEQRAEHAPQRSQTAPSSEDLQTPPPPRRAASRRSSASKRKSG